MATRSVSGHGYEHNWIESQLSHANSDPYNHARYVEQRRQMMQDWADRLDQWEVAGMQESEAQGPAVLNASASIQEQPAASAIGTGPVAVAAEATKSRPEPEIVVPLMTILARRDQRPQPVLTDIQRERAAMVEAFEAPQNLPLQVFAKLAGKSRDQINRDIKSRRVLSLTLGNRGHRIPDWQLDPLRHQFTCAVLEHAPELDGWAIYRVLSEPLEGLSGRIPADAVTPDNFDEVMAVVCHVLDLVRASESYRVITSRKEGATAPHRGG